MICIPLVESSLRSSETSSEGLTSYQINGILYKTNMKDFFGQDLQIGDRVAFNRPYYKGLSIGEVVSFTKKGIRVAYKPFYSSTAPKDTAFVYSVDVVKSPNVSGLHLVS